MHRAQHRLAVLLDRAARGEFPDPDGSIELTPAPPGLAMAVVAFTGHYVIATSAPEEWIRQRLPAGDLLAPMSPHFIAALSDLLGRVDDGVDILLAAAGLSGEAHLHETGAADHPRAMRASSYRQDVRVFTDPSGACTLITGQGLAGRLEVAVEVDAPHRGRGLAQSALIDARRRIGTDEVMFAQISPGNAASLRAFISAGFQPIGSEVLLFAERHQGPGS